MSIPQAGVPGSRYNVFITADSDVSLPELLETSPLSIQWEKDGVPPPECFLNKFLIVPGRA